MEYAPFGPQVNVPTADIIAGGWTECHSRRYDSAMSKADYESIRDSQCNSACIMIGCRQIGTGSMSVVAWAPYLDVFQPTELTNKCKDNGGIGRVSQGTKWYMYDSDNEFNRGVFGFADDQSRLDLYCVDTGTEQPEKRLSWWWDYPASTLGGYR